MLNAIDLVPFFGYFIRGGRCYYCRVRISFGYPLVELGTGVVFLLLAYFFFPVTFSQGVTLVYLLLVGALLIGISVYDYHYYLIPDVMVYTGVLASILFHFALTPLKLAVPYTESGAAGTLLAGAIGGGIFLLFHAISHGRWMGLGDAKLGALMGLVLGFPLILVALLLAFIAGGLSGIVLILMGKKTLKSHLPFGPFLALCALFVLLWGQNLVEWYLSALF